MLSFKNFLAEAVINATGTLSVKHSGKMLEFKISNIKDGPETNWDEPIKEITLNVIQGGNNFPWFLYSLAGINPSNSALTSYPYSGNKSLYYDGNKYIPSSYIAAGDQEDKSVINDVSYKKDILTISFSAAKSSDLKGKYKSFKVQIKIKDLFGQAGADFIKKLENTSAEELNDVNFFVKNFGKFEKSNKENVSIKFNAK